jgi:MFS family permease
MAENYSGQNLRGRSFEGAQLDSADFTQSDVRGADFSRASLVGANFTDARMGVRTITGLVTLAGAIVVSVLAGVVVGNFAEVTREQASSSDWRDVFASVLMVLLIVSFIAILLLNGVSQAFRAFAVAIGLVVFIDFVVVYILAGEIRFRNAVPMIAMLLLFVPAVAAGILGRMVGGAFGAWAIAFVALVGGIAAGRAHGGLSAIAVSVILVLISKRALNGDARDDPMRLLGHRIVTRRGTRFMHADLTRANFTGTNPIHSDLYSAVTTDTIWEPGHVAYTSGSSSNKDEGPSGESK